MEPITEQPVKIVLRKATLDDKEFLFGLRNDKDAYQWFSNPRPVKWEDHLKWLEDVFSGKIKKHLFIVESEEKRVGQFRLDEVSPAEAIINISLSKDCRGKGLGTLTLEEGIELAKQLGFKELIAEIHQDNLASSKLFQKLGFILKEINAPWQTFTLTL